MLTDVSATPTPTPAPSPPPSAPPSTPAVAPLSVLDVLGLVVVGAALLWGGQHAVGLWQAETAKIAALTGAPAAAAKAQATADQARIDGNATSTLLGQVRQAVVLYGGQIDENTKAIATVASQINKPKPPKPTPSPGPVPSTTRLYAVAVFTGDTTSADELAFAAVRDDTTVAPALAALNAEFWARDTGSPDLDNWKLRSLLAPPGPTPQIFVFDSARNFYGPTGAVLKSGAMSFPAPLKTVDLVNLFKSLRGSK